MTPREQASRSSREQALEARLRSVLLASRNALRMGLSRPACRGLLREEIEKAERWLARHPAEQPAAMPEPDLPPAPPIEDGVQDTAERPAPMARLPYRDD